MGSARLLGAVGCGEKRTSVNLYVLLTQVVPHCSIHDWTLQVVNKGKGSTLCTGDTNKAKQLGSKLSFPNPYGTIMDHDWLN